MTILSVLHWPSNDITCYVSMDGSIPKCHSLNSRLRAYDKGYSNIGTETQGLGDDHQRRAETGKQQNSYFIHSTQANWLVNMWLILSRFKWAVGIPLNSIPISIILGSVQSASIKYNLSLHCIYFYVAVRFLNSRVGVRKPHGLPTTFKRGTFFFAFVCRGSAPPP